MEKAIPAVSIIVPVKNEEEALPKLHRELLDVLHHINTEWEIIYVNDGSTDKTGEILESFARDDQRVRVIEFTRNFGHQSALMAGLDYAQGRYVITMDGDGQHPPSLIPEFLKKIAEGFDVVQARRVDEEGISWFKKYTSNLFYNTLNMLSGLQLKSGYSDFRCMTREVVEVIRSLHEHRPFLRGLVYWSGFRVVDIPYTARKRLGGKPKYTPVRMFQFAIDAIFSFSLVPMKLSLFIGAFFLLCAIGEMLYGLSFWIKGRAHELEPGWASIIFIILFVGGCLLIMLGIVGLYVGYIYEEVKHRPIYIVRRVLNDNRGMATRSDPFH